MNSEREKIVQQMRTKSYSQIDKKSKEQAKSTQKGNIFKNFLRLLFWRFYVFKAFLGIDEKDITSSSRGSSDTRDRYNAGRESFRERYHHHTPEPFNPEKHLIKEMAHEAYLDSLPGENGKHDCDCEHDH